MVASLFTALTASACATNPVTGQRQLTLMSEAQEIRIGQDAAGEVQQTMGLYEDPELLRYIEEVGSRLAQRSERPGLPWRFAVIDSGSVNAMALPGGPVYLTRGMLAYLNDEAELAGVMGHEVAHVTARHAVRQVSRGTMVQLGIGLAAALYPPSAAYGDLAGTGLSLLFLKHGRDAERESDRLGARYAAENGWDPGGVQDMLTTLSRIEDASGRTGIPSWLLTHPEPAARVVEVEPVVTELRAIWADGFERNRDEYLARIDGVLYGDAPREGIVPGSRFREAAGVRPSRIAIYTVRPGDTWQGIARRHSPGVVDANPLAAMNGSAPGERPPVGERIKIVRAG